MNVIQLDKAKLQKYAGTMETSNGATAAKSTHGLWHKGLYLQLDPLPIGNRSPQCLQKRSI